MIIIMMEQIGENYNGKKYDTLEWSVLWWYKIYFQMKFNVYSFILLFTFHGFLAGYKE
jgi:hypothetical protein